MSKLLPLIVTLTFLTLITNARILDSENSTLNPSEQTLENNSHRPDECKKELLDLLTMQGEKLSDPQTSSPLVMSYCRRNDNTCCSLRNIESLNEAFYKGISDLRTKFAVVEETLSLFRGPRFIEIAEMFESRCGQILEPLSVKIEGTDYGFLTTTSQRIFEDKIANLLLEFETYLKKVSWFHSNTICSFCSPTDQQFYQVQDQKTVFQVNPSTCYEVMEERLFEQHLMNVYQKYLVPIVQYMECGLREEPEVEEKADSGASESEVPVQDDETSLMTISLLDEEFLKGFNKDVQECQRDMDVVLDNCKKFCQKNWRIYDFPEPTIFNNFQVALRVLFNALTPEDQNINDYYEEIREMSFKQGMFGGPVVFFPANEFIDRYNADNAIWEIDNKGSYVYRQIMAKKFINYYANPNNSSHRLFGVLIFVLGFLML